MQLFWHKLEPNIPTALQAPFSLMIKKLSICGVDEAGRGPLVGSVVAAAVILPDDGILGLNDSKKLSAKKREMLFAEIMLRAKVGVGEASPAEIDQLNILQATMLAMRRAIKALGQTELYLQVDGNRLPDLAGLPVFQAEAIISGDALVAEISAASIVAKVTRDRQMLNLHAQYPLYGFDKHQGYPTAAHLRALELHGPCPSHRKSFRPVRVAIEGQ